MARPRRRYTDQDKAQALAAYVEVGPRKAAAQTGIPSATIASWAKEAGVRTVRNQRTAAAVEAASLDWEDRRLGLANKLGALTDEVLDQLRAELGEAGPRDAAVILGILVDKAQLLTGQATSRVDHQGDVDRQIDELLGRLPTDPAPVLQEARL